MTIFGVCQQVKDILPYASYSINVTLEEPLDAAAVLKVVSATHLLILNEFRRYLRLPVVLPVRIATTSRTVNGFSLELSAGGMSLLVPAARFHEGEGLRRNVLPAAIAKCPTTGQRMLDQRIRKFVGSEVFRRPRRM